jgi:outer membrane protein TolC
MVFHGRGKEMISTRLSAVLILLVVLWGCPGAAQANQDQEPVLDLDQLTQEAVRNNPEIQAARNKWEAMREKPAQAGALDDPMLSLGIVNLPTSLNVRSEDMTMKEIGISQKLPFPGKRALMTEMATKEAQAAHEGVAEKTLRVVRDVKGAFQDFSHVHRSLEVAQKNKEVLESLVKIVESRYSLGQAAQTDLLKAQVEVSKMTDEIIMLEERRKAVEARLNALLARPAGTALGRPTDPMLRHLRLSVDELRQLALDHNPTLKSMRRMVEAKATAQELAKADYYPDFTLRFAYGQRDNGEDVERRDMLTGMVEINLPIWREAKLERKQAETKADTASAEAQWQAMKNEIFYMIAETQAMLSRSERQIELYQGGIIPQARLQVDSNLRTYAGGRAEFMALLDSQMSLYKFELDYHQALTEYQKNMANLEALVGKPLNAGENK